MDMILSKNTEKKEMQGIPVQIATMLKVIMLHDKFEKMFHRWSTHCRDDKEILVLSMKPQCVIESSLVYTLCMMYPFRIHGPILVNDTMHIEFIHDTSRLNIEPSLLDQSCFNSQYSILHKKKRKYDDESRTEAKKTDMNETGESSRVNVEDMKSKIVDAITKTNTSRIHVQKTSNGMDTKGPWVSFELSTCDRLNLDFLGKFQISLESYSIKVFNCLISKKKFMPCMNFA